MLQINTPTHTGLLKMPLSLYCSCKAQSAVVLSLRRRAPGGRSGNECVE